MTTMKITSRSTRLIASLSRWQNAALAENGKGSCLNVLPTTLWASGVNCSALLWPGSQSGRYVKGVIGGQWLGLDGKRGQGWIFPRLTARIRLVSCCISDASVTPCCGAGLGTGDQLTYAEPRENTVRSRVGAHSSWWWVPEMVSDDR